MCINCIDKIAKSNLLVIDKKINLPLACPVCSRERTILIDKDYSNDIILKRIEETGNLRKQIEDLKKNVEYLRTNYKIYPKEKLIYVEYFDKMASAAREWCYNNKLDLKKMKKSLTFEEINLILKTDEIQTGFKLFW